MHHLSQMRLICLIHSLNTPPIAHQAQQIAANVANDWMIVGRSLRLMIQKGISLPLVALPKALVAYLQSLHVTSRVAIRSPLGKDY